MDRLQSSKSYPSYTKTGGPLGWKAEICLRGDECNYGHFEHSMKGRVKWIIKIIFEIKEVQMDWKNWKSERNLNLSWD